MASKSFGSISHSKLSFQKFTCKLLSDTVECGNLWKRCHSPNEVRSLQDMHIQARISQFRDNTDGIDVFKCPVVAEYINSGRADRVDQSTEGACTVSEVIFKKAPLPYVLFTLQIDFFVLASVHPFFPPNFSANALPVCEHLT